MPTNVTLLALNFFLHFTAVVIVFVCLLHILFYSLFSMVCIVFLIAVPSASSRVPLQCLLGRAMSASSSSSSGPYRRTRGGGAPTRGGGAERGRSSGSQRSLVIGASSGSRGGGTHRGREAARGGARGGSGGRAAERASASSSGAAIPRALLVAKAAARPVTAKARPQRRLWHAAPPDDEPAAVPYVGAPVASSPAVAEDEGRPRLRPRVSLEDERHRLRGDMSVVGPVWEDDQEHIVRLSWSSMLVVAATLPPRWLQAAPDERSAFEWVTCERATNINLGGGELPLRLAFAARSFFASAIHVCGEGLSASGGSQWAAARFTLNNTVASLDELTVGAIVVGRRDGQGTRAMWLAAATMMLELGVRVVMIFSAPQASVQEAARRFVVVAHGLLATSTVVEHQHVRLVGEGHGTSLAIVVLGRASGFTGPCVSRGAEREPRLSRADWRQAARDAMPGLQGSLDMPLPPCCVKYLIHDSGDTFVGEGSFLSVWLQGDSRRSNDAVARRAVRTRRFLSGRRKRQHRGREVGDIDPEDL